MVLINTKVQLLNWLYSLSQDSAFAPLGAINLLCELGLVSTRKISSGMVDSFSVDDELISEEEIMVHDIPGADSWENPDRLHPVEDSFEIITPFPWIATGEIVDTFDRLGSMEFNTLNIMAVDQIEGMDYRYQMYGAFASHVRNEYPYQKHTEELRAKRAFLEALDAEIRCEKDFRDRVAAQLAPHYADDSWLTANDLYNHLVSFLLPYAIIHQLSLDEVIDSTRRFKERVSKEDI